MSLSLQWGFRGSGKAKLKANFILVLKHPNRRIIVCSHLFVNPLLEFQILKPKDVLHHFQLFSN
jgi:hypothetical protein